MHKGPRILDRTQRVWRLKRDRRQACLLVSYFCKSCKIWNGGFGVLVVHSLVLKKLQTVKTGSFLNEQNTFNVRGSIWSGKMTEKWRIPLSPDITKHPIHWLFKVKAERRDSGITTWSTSSWTSAPTQCQLQIQQVIWLKTARPLEKEGGLLPSSYALTGGN